MIIKNGKTLFGTKYKIYHGELIKHPKYKEFYIDEYNCKGICPCVHCVTFITHENKKVKKYKDSNYIYHLFNRFTNYSLPLHFFHVKIVEHSDDEF